MLSSRQIEAEKRKQKLEQLKKQAEEAKNKTVDNHVVEVDPEAEVASDDSDDDEKDEDGLRYSESADMAGM